MADLPITSDNGAMPIVINDPTTVANVANVKAASTASVAADNSLVVALSPNSPVPTGTNKIGVTGVAQASTTSGQNGDLVQGAVTTANPTYTTGQTDPLSLTTAGALRTDNTSWLGSTAPTVGQKTMANSVPVVIASDQSTLKVAVQLVVGATNIFKTATFTTTATTADQVVLTYTVTAGKTFFLEYLALNSWLTSLPGNGNPIDLGSMSLESPSGTKIMTLEFFHPPQPAQITTFNTPIPITAGTVIRVVTTPKSATSTDWQANFGGYEA